MAKIQDIQTQALEISYVKELEDKVSHLTELLKINQTELAKLKDPTFRLPIEVPAGESPHVTTARMQILILQAKGHEMELGKADAEKLKIYAGIVDSAPALETEEKKETLSVAELLIRANLPEDENE